MEALLKLSELEHRSMFFFLLSKQWVEQIDALLKLYELENSRTLCQTVK